MRRFLTNTIALWLCCSAYVAAEAAPLSIGDTLDVSSLKNQHDNAFTYQQVMQAVLFVRGMKSKELIRESLNTIDLQCMTEGRLVYVADISKMPGLISKMFAIPKMRDYPYPIWLDRDGKSTQALPTKEGEVTLLHIEQQAISSVEFFSDQPSLTQQLIGICGASKQQPGNQ